MPKTLLIVSHAPSPNTRALTEAVRRGAADPAIEGVVCSVRSPFDVEPAQVLQCDALILGTTENFGYMSGALKDFFDRIYYPCLDRSRGLPYGLFVRAGNDGRGAVSSVERIVAGLGWRRICEPLVASGPFRRQQHLGDAAELGMTVAAGLEAGIF